MLDYNTKTALKGKKNFKRIEELLNQYHIP